MWNAVYLIAEYGKVRKQFEQGTVVWYLFLGSMYRMEASEVSF